MKLAAGSRVGPYEMLVASLIGAAVGLVGGFVGRVRDQLPNPGLASLLRELVHE